MGFLNRSRGVIRNCSLVFLILGLAACSDDGASTDSTPIDNVVTGNTVEAANTVADSVQVTGNKIADSGIEPDAPVQSESLTNNVEPENEEVEEDTVSEDTPQSSLLQALGVFENSGMDLGDIIDMLGRSGFDSQDNLESLLPFLLAIEGETCVASDINTALQMFNSLESLAGELSLDDVIRLLPIDSTDNLYDILHDLLGFASDNSLLCDDTLSILQYLGESSLNYFGLQATSLTQLLDQFGLSVDLSVSEAMKIVGLGSGQTDTPLVVAPVTSEAANAPIDYNELIQIIGNYKSYLELITIDELIAVLPIDTTESLEDNLDDLLTFASEQAFFTDDLLLLLGQWGDSIVSGFGSRASNLTELLNLFGLSGDLTLEDALNLFI